ncbi:MAG: hypothetical protein GTO08_04800, partial [Deltaproteobacteria bacterium]|nr:hypothetical protein [Deltaproteobacteria bacterium]
MPMKRHVFLIFIWAAFFTAISCSQNPKDLAAKHTRKGDLYFSEKKFMEAAVEYRNAIKGAPEDAGLRWKLAQSAMEAR